MLLQISVKSKPQSLIQLCVLQIALKTTVLWKVSNQIQLVNTYDKRQKILKSQNSMWFKVIRFLNFVEKITLKPGACF